MFVLIITYSEYIDIDSCAATTEDLPDDCTESEPDNCDDEDDGQQDQSSMHKTFFRCSSRDRFYSSVLLYYENKGLCNTAVVK